METNSAVMSGGTDSGRMENVEPVRFIPSTRKFGIVAPGKAVARRTAVISGACVTIKFWLDVAATPPTVTEIGPVLAPSGTIATRVVAVAEVTAAEVLLKRTVLSGGFALKSCP